MPFTRNFESFGRYVVKVIPEMDAMGKLWDTIESQAVLVIILYQM